MGWLKQKLYMPNYYADLRNRFQSYQARFSTTPKRTALRMIWWNFKSLFKRHGCTVPVSAPSKELNADDAGKYTAYVDFLVNQRKGYQKTFVPLAADSYCRRKQDTRIIAWYLPQYYQMEVNDKYHGRGFTEWTNTTQAIPLYTGHYQPHVPYDVGYYNLGNLNTMKRQVELAKQYGIYGFCFHWYWFSGERTMEKPVEMYLAHPELDLPFCLNWANENWTSAWDGGNRDLIFEQRLDECDDVRFINDMLPYFKDSRYIKIDGRPVLSIYYCSTFPKQRFCDFLSHCKETARNAGFPDLYVMLTTGNNFNGEAAEWGADALVEYPTLVMGEGDRIQPDGYVNPDFKGCIWDYSSLAETGRFMRRLNSREYFRSAMVGFDNTARKASMENCMIMDNATPQAYKMWLKRIMEESKQIHSQEKDIVFVLAWNEWAEAAHLEPDMKFGYGYLQASREAVEEVRTLDENVILEQVAEKKEHGITKLRFYIHCIESLGDVIACEPIARYLKEIEPNCYIAWLVKEVYQEIVCYNPYIDEVITVDCLSTAIDLCHSYRKQKDSVIIDCHHDGRRCTKTDRIHRNPNNPMVNDKTYFQYGSLLAAFCLSAGLPALRIPPIFHENPMAAVPPNLPERFVAIQCGSAEECKEWGKGKWSTLTNSLIEAGWNVVELGLRPFVQCETSQYYDYTNIRNLQTIAQVIKRASCFIGIDSAFAHLANCYNIPGVIILGRYKNFELYNPYTGGYADGENATLVYAENAPASEVLVQRVYEAALYQMKAEGKFPSRSSNFR